MQSQAVWGPEYGEKAESGSFRQILRLRVKQMSTCIEGAVTFVTGAVRSTPDARSLVAREGGGALGKFSPGFAAGLLPTVRGRDWHAGNVMKKIDFKSCPQRQEHLAVSSGRCCNAKGSSSASSSAQKEEGTEGPRPWLCRV